MEQPQVTPQMVKDHGLNDEEYRKIIERWVSRGAPGSRVTTIEAGEKGNGGFFVNADLISPGYARIMGRQLMIFKPAIVGRFRNTSFTDNERVYPVVLDADAFSESVEIELPRGFAVDEMPQSISLENDFGKYSAKWRFDDGKVYFNRTMMIENSIIDTKDYVSVKDFFNRIIAAEQASIVLSRQ